MFLSRDIECLIFYIIRNVDTCTILITLCTQHKSEFECGSICFRTLQCSHMAIAFKMLPSMLPLIGGACSPMFLYRGPKKRMHGSMWPFFLLYKLFLMVD